MRISMPQHLGKAVLVLSAGLLLSMTAAAQSPRPGWEPGRWQFGATLYAYLPSIGGDVSFPVASGGASIDVDADTLIDGLKFTFMGSLDAHNGRWGLFTDVLYIDVGGDKSNTRDFSIGSIGLPASTTANLDLDLKGFIWTVAGEYRITSDAGSTLDVFAGARFFAVKPKLGFSIDGNLGAIGFPVASGSEEVKQDVWDGIIGLRGRYAFGQDRKWFIPFYLDVGTGESDLTWQGAAGIGYTFGWGSAIAMWRYLDYHFKSGKPIESMNFSGPLIGATFRW